MHTFQINDLIQFLVSSTCFDHHVFIIRKTKCTCSFLWHVFMHICSFFKVCVLCIYAWKHTIKKCMYKWYKSFFHTHTFF